VFVRIGWKTCHGKTLHLITKIRKLQTKKFYNIGQRIDINLSFPLSKTIQSSKGLCSSSNETATNVWMDKVKLPDVRVENRLAYCAIPSRIGFTMRALKGCDVKPKLLATLQVYKNVEHSTKLIFRGG